MTIRLRFLFCVALLYVLSGAVAWAQSGVTVDYNNPKKYIVGGVTVEGNNYVNRDQIVQTSGLREGMEVTVPSDFFSLLIDKMWSRRYFEDVSVAIDSLSAARDTAFFKIRVTERPRVSRWTFSGIKSGDQKDLKERLNLKPGGVFSDYVAKTSTDIIKRFYDEKGYNNATVDIQTKRDTLVKGAIRVNFAISKNEKVRIKKIDFGGVYDVKESKLVKSMKKTRDKRLQNFFKSKKFNETEFKNDKKGLIEAFNEAGYRDARILSDTVYFVEPGKLEIDFKIDQGKKYYFRNVTWTGNSVYPAEALNDILQIKKGDVYDVVTMEKRLFGGGKQNEYDVSKLYRDNGYLFFNIQPVELNVVGDSVDVEMLFFQL